MNASARNFAVPFLRWTTGLVVLWESWRTFHGALEHLRAPGHPAAFAQVRLGLSAPEIFGAILFLIPPTEKIGGSLLLVIFGLAIVFHLLHGDFGGIEILFVYAAAVFACMAFRAEPARS